MGWRHWVAVGVLLGACDKQGSTGPPPGAVAATPVPAEPEPEPEPEPAPEAEAEPDEEGEAGDAEPEQPEEVTAEDGWDAADAHAAELTSGASYYLTPALPSEWPPGEGTRVMYLLYPLEPIKGGAVEEYTCRQASHKITFDLAAHKTDHEQLQGRKKIGKLKQERRSASDPIRGAESALYEVVFEGKDPEKVKYVLHRYADWLDKHATIAKDLRKRLPEFVRFVHSVN